MTVISFQIPINSIMMENSLITAFLVGLRQISLIRDKKGGKLLSITVQNSLIYRYLFSLSFSIGENDEMFARGKIHVSTGIATDIDAIDMSQAVA